MFGGRLAGELIARVAFCRLVRDRRRGGIDGDDHATEPPAPSGLAAVS